MANAFRLWGELDLPTAAFKGALRDVDSRLKQTQGSIGEVETQAKRLGVTLTATTARSIEKVGLKVSEARSDMDALSRAFDRGDISAKQFARGMESVDRAARSADSRLRDINARVTDLGSAKVGQATASINNLYQALLVVGAANFLKDAGRSVLDYSSNLEQAKIGFESFTGSAVKAQKHIEDLQKFAAGTPFRFEELVDASRKMQGVGIEAERVIPVLKDVGNTLAAAGRLGELPLAIKALSDIQAKGKLAGQEVIQLANAGIPIRDTLAKLLGVSAAEVIKLGESGQISAEMVFEALHKMSNERFGDAMEKQSKTFGGAMSNIQDTLQISSQKAFAPYYEQISKIGVETAKSVQNQQDDFTGVGITIASAIAEGVGQSLPGLVVGTIKGTIKAAAAEISGEGVLGGITKGLGGSLLSSLGVPDNFVQQFKDRISNPLGGFDRASGEDPAGRGSKPIDPQAVKNLTDSYKQGADAATKLAQSESEASKELKQQMDLVDSRMKVRRAEIALGEDALKVIRETAQVEKAALQEKLALETDSDKKTEIENSIKALEFETKKKVAAEEYRLELERQKKIKEDIAKLDQMQEKAIGAVNSLAGAQNNVFVDAYLALEKMRESTVGLSENLRKAALSAVQLSNSEKLFKAILDSQLGAASLGRVAERFRGPTQTDLLASANRSLALSGASMNAQGDLEITNAFGRNVEAIDDYARRRFGAVENFDKNERMKDIDAAMRVLNASPANAEQQGVVDRAMLDFAQKFGVDDFNPSQREMVARAADREQTRAAESVTKQREFFEKWMDFRGQIKQEFSELKDTVKSGGALAVKISDEDGIVSKVKTPTPKDVRISYGLHSGADGLSSY